MKLTYKEIMSGIKFNRERINELSERLKTQGNPEVRRGSINEMMERAEEIGRLDTLNKKRIISKLEEFKNRLGL